MALTAQERRQAVRRLLRLLLLVNAIGIGVAVAIRLYSGETELLNSLGCSWPPCCPAGSCCR